MKYYTHKTSKSKTVQKKRSGFTMVEVTLVTAFVAMLLITIAIIITNISAFYQKGLTLKEVNSVGRNLVEELTSGINSAPSLDTRSLCEKFLDNDSAIDACKKEGAYNYIFQEATKNDMRDNTDSSPSGTFTAQLNGVFCTGNYSYLWNTHYGIRQYKDHGNNTVLTLKYINEDTDAEETYDFEEYGTLGNKEPFRLIRIEDHDRLACAKRVNKNDYSYSTDNVIDVRETYAHMKNKIPKPVTNFLDNADDIQLDLYELTIFPPGQDSVTQRALFAGTFILATDLGNINITRSGDYCVTDGKGEKDDESEDSTNSIFSMGSNFNYCGINKFNFAARTAGSGIIK